MKKFIPPAFPSVATVDVIGEWSHEGMTLLDYFAAKAMHALVSQERNIIAMAAEQGAREEICADAYKIAIQMMVEKAKIEQ